MKKIKWNEEKNNWLKENRWVSFEEILIKWNFLKDIQNPKRENQRIFIYEYNNYPYCLPYVENIDHIFLKTLYPERKFKFLLNNN